MKPKIWKEWKKIYVEYYLLKIPCFRIEVRNFTGVSGKLQCWSFEWKGKSSKDFRTKEKAMLKAQQLIVEECKKIQRVMEDKV